jgi:hypothetical protein
MTQGVDSEYIERLGLNSDIKIESDNSLGVFVRYLPDKDKKILRAYLKFRDFKKDSDTRFQERKCFCYSRLTKGHRKARVYIPKKNDRPLVWA